MWTSTSTIVVNENQGPAEENQGSNTHSMAFSSKEDDHTQDEKLFRKELQDSKTKGGMAHHGGLRKLKMIKCKVGTWALNVDRPERTSTCLLANQVDSLSNNKCHLSPNRELLYVFDAV